MQAVRLARYHTKRAHLVRFCGAYHGWWGDVQPGAGNPTPARETYTLKDMDDDTLHVLRTRDDIACVLVNPIQALHPNGAPANDSWHIRALAATALAAVREIEVLEASHIVEPDDGAMTLLEKRMSSAGDTARNALTALAALVPPAVSPQVLAAESALNKFLELHIQIIALSRRNSDVRSLALSLGELRNLHGQCEDDLRALADAIDKRGFKATR